MSAAAALPVPATAAIRLAYVLRHFRLAYDEVPALEISYAGAASAVTIAEASEGFFEQAAPYAPAPNFRLWAGQRVPFFFDSRPKQPLLELGAGTATVHSDVISGAFYLLSGWQEYFSPARDRHGRFPYAASVQQQYGFVTVPVVNYYFDVLKTAIEHVTGLPLKSRRWNGAALAGFITHDIDSLHGGWGTAARLLLRRGRLAGLAQLVAAKVRKRPGPWNNLEQVQAETARNGAPSTFFILGSHQPAPNGTANADYQADTPAFQARLRTLVTQGAEVASHASYGTAEDEARLRTEQKQLNAFRPLGNRFHYLCWEPTTTPMLLAETGVAYDSTLGFAEHFGFRNSYCLPFFPFDFAQGQAHSFLEIPLNVMDATLHHPSYLQLEATEILPALRPLFDEMEKFGGVATILWHNDHFDPANRTTGPRQFAEIMADLTGRGTAFLTGSQIVAELCPKVK